MDVLPVHGDSAAIDVEVDRHLALFAHQVDQVDEVRGIGSVAVAAIIAEIGVDVTRFPISAPFVFVIQVRPSVKSSAGRTKGSGSSGHGKRPFAIQARA